MVAEQSQVNERNLLLARQRGNDQLSPDRCNYRTIIIVGCVQALQAKALSPRICDGVIDCPDLSDEKNCAYCRDGYMHCGVGRTCIPRGKRCDGKLDCANGSDEKDCRTYDR